MSIQFTSTSTYLTRTTGLVQGSAASYSWCCWFRPDTDVTVSRQTVATLKGAGAICQGVYSNAVTNAYRLEVNNGGGANNSSTHTLTAGHWYPIGYHKSVTSHQYYVGNVFIDGVTVNMAAVTFTGLFLGGDGAGTNAGTFAYFREWTAVLTTAEFAAEFNSRTAIKTASLVTDTSLTSTLLDATSNHHDWTAVGAGYSFVSDDPIPAGAAAADPIVITLPYSTTVDVKPTNVEFIFDHWLTYTAVSPEVYIGGWFFGQLTAGQYEPSTEVFSDAGVTRYPPHNPIGPSGSQSLRFQIPVTAGDSYWFKANGFSGANLTSHTLTMDFLTAPMETIPAGSLFINDDTQDYFAAVISSTPGDNNHVLGFFPFAVTNPEQGGDVSNSNGSILVQDTTNGKLNYYDQDLTLQSATTIATSNTGIVRRVPDGSAFYYNVTNTVTRVSKAGVYGASHALTGVSSMRAFAPNTDETILYAYITASVNNPIKKWDLVNDVYLADLVAGVAGSAVRDLLVLTDGSIVAQRMAGSVMSIVQYSAAGAVLQTVAIGSGSPGSLAYDYTAPVTHVLVRAQDLAYTGSSSLFRVNLTDGSKTQTDFVVFEGGVYAAAETATPIAKFGVSNSCPFFPIAFSTPAPVVEPTEYLIRRERWFPHIGQEQLRQFFSKLQIDLYAGNGISTGQGSDPLLEIDWSDDGGHTWSDIHFVQTGAIGAYRTRAILRRMGSSRDRVYRIACSDPVQWSVVNGYLDATLGTS